MKLPIAIELAGLSILFVGGGKAVLQKLKALRPFVTAEGPKITIVAPSIDPQLRVLCADAVFEERGFKEADLQGVDLVYGFTNDEALNSRVSDLCRQKHIWANVSKAREFLSFTSPTIRIAGDNIISVSRTDNDARRSVELADALIDFARSKT